MNLWIPYIETVNNVSMPKQIMTARMEEIMKGKRPRKRWAVEFEEDLNVNGIRNWHAVARGGKACRKTVLEARVRNGG
jgi:hypothetical protein